MIDEEKHLDDTQAAMPSETESSDFQPEAQADASSGEPNPASSGDEEKTLDQITLEDLEAENAAFSETGPTATSPTAKQEGEKEATEEAGIDATVIKDLTQELESLKSQLEERTSQYVRLVADFDNFRKRTQKEREEMEDQVKCSTLVELLPVVDNFERARSQIKPQTDGEMNIHKSYQSVYKQLVDCLKRIGVAPMRAEGQEFDPNWHEAVLREQTSEYPEGTVIEELVRGYVLGDRVLRHAMVKVAAVPEAVIPSEGDHQDR